MYEPIKSSMNLRCPHCRHAFEHEYLHGYDHPAPDVVQCPACQEYGEVEYDHAPDTGVSTELRRIKPQSYFFKVKIPGSWKDAEIVTREFGTWDQAITHAQDLANRTGRTVSMSARSRFRHGHIFQPNQSFQHV